MREDLQHKEIKPLEGLFYVLLIVICMAILVFIIGFIAYLLKLQILTVIAFVIIAIAATFLMRNRLQNYAYILNKGFLIMMRCIGTNEKPIVTARVQDIKWYGVYSKLPEEYRKITREKVTFHKNEDYKTVVFRTDSGHLRVARFSPTPEFWDALVGEVEKIRNKKTSCDGGVESDKTDLENQKTEQGTANKDSE